MPLSANSQGNSEETTTNKSLEESSGDDDNSPENSNSDGIEIVEPQHINTDIPKYVDKQKHVGEEAEISANKTIAGSRSLKTAISHESSNVNMISHEHGISGVYKANSNVVQEKGKKMSAFCERMSFITFKFICH